MKTQKESEYRIEIEYDRLVNGYKPGDMVGGYIKLIHATDKSFKLDVGLVIMKIKGQIIINYQNSSKFKDFSNKSDIPKVVFIQTQPRQLLKNQIVDQSTKLNFKFKLEQKDHPYQQSYIGMFFSIVYQINVQFKALGGRIISNAIPFYIQVFQAGRNALQCQFQYPKKVSFLLTDDQSTPVPGVKKAKFKIKGQFASQICYLIVDNTDTPIKTVDLQLVRVQSLVTQKFTQKTQIQLIQVCDGNITPKIQIPIYMMFPKYHSCPSVNYKGYKIDFQVNLNIVFEGGYKVTCNRPIKILRS